MCKCKSVSKVSEAFDEGPRNLEKSLEILYISYPLLSRRRTATVTMASLFAGVVAFALGTPFTSAATTTTTTPAPPLTSNITVYRITPRNYTGLTNFDSGSSAGDAFFGIYELQTPLVCKDPTSQNILCQNQPILQIPGFNVYTRTTVEIDNRFGDYSECNPDPTNGTFVCQHFHFHHGSPTCWYNDKNNPAWAKEFASECEVSSCTCDAVEKKSVGQEFPGSKFGSFYPKDWPQQCLDDFYSVTSHVFSANVTKPTQILYNTDEGDCCHACSSTPRKAFSGCGGYTYHQKNKTCETYGLFAKPTTRVPAGGDARSGFNLKGSPYWSVLGSATSQLATILNGSWYSTREEGECPPHESPKGDGKCWWRTVEQTSNVNASCVNGNVIKVVQQTRPGCWDACGPIASKNISDVCFIKCVFETIVGNRTKGHVVAPMKKQVLIDAFEKSFNSNDVEHGCPQVAKCEPPCHPPGGGLVEAVKDGLMEEGVEEEEEQKFLYPVEEWFEEEVVGKGKWKW